VHKGKITGINTASLTSLDVVSNETKFTGKLFVTGVINTNSNITTEGVVTAVGFTGELNGNASSATKASSLSMLSISNESEITDG
jgi:hypothetical protein